MAGGSGSIYVHYYNTPKNPESSLASHHMAILHRNMSTHDMPLPEAPRRCKGARGWTYEISRVHVNVLHPPTAELCLSG